MLNNIYAQMGAECLPVIDPDGVAPPSYYRDLADHARKLLRSDNGTEVAVGFIMFGIADAAASARRFSLVPLKVAHA